MKKNKKNKKSRKNNILIFIGILIVIAFFGVFAQSLINQSYNGEEKTYLSYNESSNVNYQVYLNENSFFSSSYLTKDYNYIAALTDHINTSFNYNLNLDDYVDGTYSYYIRGVLLTKERANQSPLWQEVYVLKTKETFNLNHEKDIKITDNLVIDYEEYYKLVSDFINTYSVTVDSTLDVELVINYNFNYNKFENPVMGQKKISLSIPISNVTYDIKGYNDTLSTSDNFSEVSKEARFNAGLRNIGYIMWAIDIVIIIITLIFVSKLSNQKTKYAKMLQKILKNYDSVVVNVVTLPDLDKYNIINVTNFKELADLQAELRIPITFKEIKKDHESIFVIINNNEAWVYNLNLNDLNKKGKEIFKI